MTSYTATANNNKRANEQVSGRRVASTAGSGVMRMQIIRSRALATSKDGDAGAAALLFSARLKRCRS